MEGEGGPVPTISQTVDGSNIRQQKLEGPIKRAIRAAKKLLPKHKGDYEFPTPPGNATYDLPPTIITPVTPPQVGVTAPPAAGPITRSISYEKAINNTLTRATAAAIQAKLSEQTQSSGGLSAGTQGMPASSVSECSQSSCTSDDSVQYPPLNLYPVAAPRRRLQASLSAGT